MNTVTKKTILRELTKLDLAYGSRKTGDELGLLAGIWWEDCRHMGEKYFLESVKRVRRQSQFFPTTAEVLAEYRVIVAELPNQDSQNLLAMPLEMSDDQIEINRKGIEMLRKRLAKKT